MYRNRCSNFVFARHAKLDPEGALRRANTKFEQRFRYIECALATRGVGVDQASLEEMDALWEEAKGLGERPIPD